VVVCLLDSKTGELLLRISFKADLTPKSLAAGSLNVEVTTIEGDETSSTSLHFSLVDKFHAHQDCIGVALATLCGTKYDYIEYDFAISKQVREAIAKHCKADVVATGEIEPRQSGERTALNFSGGFDSLAAYLLAPHSVDLVSVDFGGSFARERGGFDAYSPRVICETDFRQKGFALNDWRFMAVGSILHADVLGLGAMSFGSILEATPWNFVMRRPGQIAVRDPLFGAIGLNDYSPIRGLSEFGTAMVVLSRARDGVETSLMSLAAPGTEKGFRKQLIVDTVAHHMGSGAAPDFDQYQYPREKTPFGKSFTVDFLTLYFVRLYGKDIVSRWMSGLDDLDMSWIKGLDLRFYERYATNFIHEMPSSVRNIVLDGYHDCGIYPFDEQDWVAFSKVREFLRGFHRIP